MTQYRDTDGGAGSFAGAPPEPPAQPPEEPPEQPQHEPDPPPQDRGSSGALFALVRETVTVVVIALGLSLLIKTFLVQAFFIPSQSMENTLLIGDRVLVSKLTPGPIDLKRGDVVVFKDPGGWLPSTPPVDEGPLRDGFRDVLTFVGLLPADSGDHLIKRVIGLPGDKVICCDAKGRITVNGAPIQEPYLYPGDQPSEGKTFNTTVPAGRLWVMGDHREVSQDSRFHPELAGGTVSIKDDVVGRAFVVVWPFSHAKILHNPGSVFADVPRP